MDRKQVDSGAKTRQEAGSAGASMRKPCEDLLVQCKPPAPQILEATERKDGQWSVT